jgi:predicted  nucleic acid-binding Zn-ribbon protein
MIVRWSKWQCVKCGQVYFTPTDEVLDLCTNVVDPTVLYAGPKRQCYSQEFLKIGEVIDKKRLASLARHSGAINANTDK